MAHIPSFLVLSPDTRHIKDGTMSSISHVLSECSRQHTQTVAHPAFWHWIEPTSSGLAHSPQRQTLSPLMSLAFRFLPARVGSESRKVGSVGDSVSIMASMSQVATSGPDKSVPRPSTISCIRTSKLNESVSRLSTGMARSKDRCELALADLALAHLSLTFNLPRFSTLLVISSF